MAKASNVSIPELDATGPIEGDGQPVEDAFNIHVKLPHEPFQIQIIVSMQEQVQYLRRSITVSPYTLQYSCFHLEYNGERLSDPVELSAIPGIGPEAVLELIEDPYTEKEARIHFIRMRKLVGASDDKFDAAHGAQAGISLFDDVSAQIAVDEKADGTPIDGYDFEGPAVIQTMLPRAREPAPITLKALSLSPWNPPPYHLRVRGHLLYIHATTLEGEQYQITSHISGFYADKSTSQKFDPSPMAEPKDAVAHSLLTLFSRLSPGFDAAFHSLMEHNTATDPLSRSQISNAIPASPWLVSPPANVSNSHRADIARTQEGYLFSGLESHDSPRDWHEEFQSTRELPRGSVQDRFIRDGLISKLLADYNAAAVRGAVLVARGEIPALNPTEDRRAQVFVCNNIFFSFGIDGLETFAADGGDEAAHVAAGKDVVGVKVVNQLDINGLFTPATIVVDYLGKRIVGQSIVPGIFKQRDPDEPLIDYGGAQGKDVVSENEAFAPLFKQLSEALGVKEHPVWDKNSRRHDVKVSVETKGFLGTDGRRYVLDLYRITPPDVHWLEQHWEESAGDGRPKHKERDYPHRMAVLRPELVESYADVRLREFAKAEVARRFSAKNAASKQASSTQKTGCTNETSDTERCEIEDELVDVPTFRAPLNPDVFCGQVPPTEEEMKDYTSDELEVRAACAHLVREILPQLVHDLQQSSVVLPGDGWSLIRLLHKRGINVRYIGLIATMADKDDGTLKLLRRLAIQEMIARGFKHVVNKSLNHLPPAFSSVCIAHLLNCLLGATLNANPVAEIGPSLRELYVNHDFGFEASTPTTLRAAVVDQIRMRFRFEMGDIWIEPGRELQMLREVSRKLGLQLGARNYAFTSEQAARALGAETADCTPETMADGHTPGAEKTRKKTNKKKKKKNAKGAARTPSRAASPAVPSQEVTFHGDDVVNFVPVVKTASPKSALIDEIFNKGRIMISEGRKELADLFLLDSLALLDDVYGLLHPEVARCYWQLANLLHSMNDDDAAVEIARKAVIISERTLGVDSWETAQAYVNLGFFEHAGGSTKAALGYIRHGLELWKIICGDKHPVSILTVSNAAGIFRDVKQHREARLWFESCLARCEEVHGKQSIHTGIALRNLSQALAWNGDMHVAVNRLREAYTILNRALGPNDPKTKEVEASLEYLTGSAVAQAKQVRQVQARVLRCIGMPPRTERQPQPSVGPTVSEAAGAPPSSDKGTKNDNVQTKSAEELARYVEGDGPKKGTANEERRQQRRKGPRRRGHAVGN